MKHTIPITEARKNIFALINDVNIKGTRYILTDKGHAKAIIMSAEEFEAWQETLEVMKDFPDLDEAIKKAHDEYSEGKYVTLEKLLMNGGYIMDKARKKYDIPGRSSKTNRKKN